MNDQRNDETTKHTTTDADSVDRFNHLNDPVQYRYFSAEELRTFLSPNPEWCIADLGSGTGFYTDEIAPVVNDVYAIDTSEEMHHHYCERGAPANVKLITGDVSSIPLSDSTCDAAMSIRTFHHGVAEALPEVRRLLSLGGRFVIMDWSANGEGDRNRGPDPDDCFDLATVQSILLNNGFRIQSARERRETFVIVAQLE